MFVSCFPWLLQRGGAVIEHDGKDDVEDREPVGEGGPRQHELSRQVEYRADDVVHHQPDHPQPHPGSRRDSQAARAFLDQIVGQGRVCRPGDRRHGINPRIDSSAMSHDWGVGVRCNFMPGLRFANGRGA